MGERVRLEGRPVEGTGQIRPHRSVERLGAGREILRHGVGQGFFDHMVSGERHAEDAARHAGDGGPPVVGLLPADHRGTGADAGELRVARALTETADEHRHIRTLSPAIGM